MDIAEISKLPLDEVNSVYGPVRSWRVGASLGVDLICINSVCSFNCTYCQLGNIQVRTNERQIFVPTAKVMTDFANSRWQESDIITFSGSGEPTLALNLGECIAGIGSESKKPILVLTNGTLIQDPQVRSELALADRVYLKLDAPDEDSLRRINRPVSGVTLEGIIEGAAAFRNEYQGYFGLQMMCLHSSTYEIRQIAELIRRISPDEVQVNTPTRPYPDAWYLASRGSHDGVDYPAKFIKPLSLERLDEIVTELQDHTEGIKILSVRRRPA